MRYLFLAAALLLAGCSPHKIIKLDFYDDPVTLRAATELEILHRSFTEEEEVEVAFCLCGSGVDSRFPYITSIALPDQEADRVSVTFKYWQCPDLCLQSGEECLGWGHTHPDGVPVLSEKDRGTILSWWNNIRFSVLVYREGVITYNVYERVPSR